MQLTNSSFQNKSHKPQWYQFDFPLLALLMCLMISSMLILYSAAGADYNLIIKQAIRLIVATAIMLSLSYISPYQLKRSATLIFILSLTLLITVLLLGVVGKGAQRWLSLGFVRIQPSELIKLALPLMLASYLCDKQLPPLITQLLTCLLIIIIPTALVAKQPDLGTALLISGSGIGMLFVAGLSWRLIAYGAALTTILLPILWLVMHDYQKQRVLTFLNPATDPLGSGYHIIQSKIAIGSGGFWGKGFLNGTQAQLQFLPERSTDFIFAVLSEELGFIGAITLIMIYTLVIIRCWVISLQAQDTFCRLLSSAITISFFLYVVINIAMVIGLLPVVGVPLPLISYGGSSMVTLMAGFGIMLSIARHRRFINS